VDGARFHKHQGSGWWAQRLGSGGHRSSFLIGPLIFGSRLIDLMNTQASWNRSATQQNLVMKAKARILSVQARPQRSIALKGSAVIY
jgi:hypothetical protein